DGYLPQPGWDSAYDWQGEIAFEDHPVSYNPESGYIVTANNPIVNDDYPYFLSRDWDRGHRAARIVDRGQQLLDARQVTAVEMAELLLDNALPGAEALQEAYPDIEVEGDGVRRALDLLADWHGQNEPGSSGAAFPNVLWNHVTF